MDVVVEAASAVHFLNSLCNLLSSIAHLTLGKIHHAVLHNVGLEVSPCCVSEGDVDKVALFEGLDVFCHISVALEALVKSHFGKHA